MRALASSASSLFVLCDGQLAPSRWAGRGGERQAAQGRAVRCGCHYEGDVLPLEAGLRNPPRRWPKCEGTGDRMAAAAPYGRAPTGISVAPVPRRLGLPVTGLSLIACAQQRSTAWAFASALFLVLQFRLPFRDWRRLGRDGHHLSRPSSGCAPCRRGAFPRRPWLSASARPRWHGPPLPPGVSLSACQRYRGGWAPLRGRLQWG